MVHLNQQQEPMDFMKLNFLTEKPAVNWIDFFVQTTKFEEYLDGSLKDPPLHVLISEFTEKALWEQQESLVVDYAPDERQRHAAKATKLWSLALACCAHTDWDVKSLCTDVPLHHLKLVFDRLFLFGHSKKVDKQQDYQGFIHDKIVEKCGKDFEWSGVPNAERAVLWLYARFCVAVDLHNRVPAPPPRVSVYNQQATQDLNVVAASKNRAALATLRSWLAECVQLLQLVATDHANFGNGMRLPNMHAFLPPAQDASQQFVPDLDRSTDPITHNALVVLAKYDSLRFHFAEKAYALAKQCLGVLRGAIQGSRWSLDECSRLVDVDTLNGFAQVFGQPAVIQLKDQQQQSTSSLADPLDERVGGLAECQCQLLPTSGSRARDEFTRWDLLHSVLSRQAIDARFEAVLTNEASAVEFVKLLGRRFPTLSADEQCVVAAYLHVLVLIFPNLRPILTSNSQNLVHLLTGLPKKAHWLADTETPAFTKPAADFWTDAQEFSHIDGENWFWTVLCSFDPAQIRQALSQSAALGRANYSECAPTAYSAPAVLQDMIVKANNSSESNLELLTVFAYKMQQLADLKLNDTWSVFAGHFMGSFGGIELDVAAQSAITSEAIRMKLLCWHDQLCATVDLARFKTDTAALTSEVKSYIDTVVGARLSSTQSPAPSEVAVLLAAFLLNTSDMEYMIKCDQFTNRFFDLSRLLAAVCDEVGKCGGANALSQSARAGVEGVHRYLLPILDCAGPPPSSTRFAKGEPPKRDPKLLMSRTDLMLLLSYIKEETLLSIMLAYFCRLLEQTENAWSRGVFAEKAYVWTHVQAELPEASADVLYTFIRQMIDNLLAANANNAFALRSLADLQLAQRRPADALSSNLQCLAVSTLHFQLLPADNIVDDKLYANMQECCALLSCPTEYMLLSQFRASASPDSKQIYVNAVKWFGQCVQPRDAGDSLFEFVWDMNLAEYLLDHLQKNGMPHKADILIKVMTAADMNVHNAPAARELMVMYKRKAFCRLLCDKYFA